MPGKPKKSPREKDLTSRYLSGRLDEDRTDKRQLFTQRSANAEQNKIEKTAQLRAADEELASDIESLPVGEVVQVFSLYTEVFNLADGTTYLATTRKTLNKLRETGIVVGDRVRFRPTGRTLENGRPEATVEQTLPRDTVLTRADSFKAITAHPIVANADQMLIVAAVAHPYVKWGLIDRMLIAAQSGGLRPILCLNKLDLVDAGDHQAQREIDFATEAMNHYATLGIQTLRTSAESGAGLGELKMLLANQTTVLAGHSGVGKSSLIRAIQPQLDLRIGAISGYTGKGRHTTTSARRYELTFGGHVVDTPGVKLFGLWNVTAENLADFFPDVAANTAPEWRGESYQRILESLAE